MNMKISREGNSIYLHLSKNNKMQMWEFVVDDAVKLAKIILASVECDDAVTNLNFSDIETVII